MTTFLLLPSPLLGAAPWMSTADALRAQGCRAEVSTVAGVADAFAVPGAREDVVLVPHSNAGLYAPSLAERIGARATVYVDAALPLVPGPDTALAPPDLLAFLETLADGDGMLPPWTQWWDDVGELFPDDETRETVEAGQPRLPLSYFRRRVPVPPGWTSRRCGYLGFGSTYAEEMVFAREHGWPVTELPGGHLQMLHDPDRVATEIRALLDAALAGAGGVAGGSRRV